MDEKAYSQLEEVVRLFQEHGLQELVVEEGGLKVHLRSAPVRSGPATRPRRRAAARRPEKAQALQKTDRTVAIRSPLIGTFYRSPASDAPAFVELGGAVEQGETVGIVEAMKVFNEIKAEWSGRAVAIPADNGKLVQAGEPLIILELSDGQ